MTKILHILNGDSTLSMMEKVEVPGEKIVWRDVLSEGPVISDFASDAFWKIRSDFMCDAFGATPEGFKAKCIDEFSKAEASNQFYEITLWFEYDLFCQINMLGILHFLLKTKNKAQISLVCVGHESGFDRLVGIGELTPERLPKLFEERSLLNLEDLQYAASVYQAYCSDDPRDIHKSIGSNSKFPYLKGAFDAHLKRFPFKSSRLTEIEQCLIDLSQQGAKTPKEVVGKALRWQHTTYYGFGDTQYFIYLKRLGPLFNSDFASKPDTSNVELIKRNYQLGGAQVSDWVWDNESSALIPA